MQKPALAIALPLLLLLAGCTGPPQGDGIAVSSYPVQYLAERITAGLVPVARLTPPGVDLHEFEPTIREIQTLRGSRVLVVHGLGVEPWVERAVESLGSDAPQVLEVAAVAAGEGFLPLGDEGDDPGEDGHGHGHAHGDEARDPHTWLDPRAYAAEARLVSDGLAKAYPEHAAAFANHTALLLADLAQLDLDMAAGLHECDRRTVVTNHDAYSYLARRYRLEVVSLHGLEPGAQADPQSVRDVIDTIRATGTTTMFLEDGTDPDAVAAIVAETGVATGVLHVAESPHPTLDYLGLQRENLASLQAALGCAA